MKHKSVSFMSLLGLYFPFASIALTLMWTFAMAAAPGSENPSLTTFQLSLSLPGSALCLGWHSQTDVSPDRETSSSLSFPRVVPKTLLFLEIFLVFSVTRNFSVIHNNILHIPYLTNLFLSSRYLEPTFIFKILCLLCPLSCPILSLLSGPEHPLQLQTSGLIINMCASPYTIWF